MTEREVRYCTTEDGVRIAYCIEGDGPPLLITPYFFESFSLHHLFPAFGDFMRRVATGHTAVRFDVRGCGLSQRAASGNTLDSGVRDIEAVVEATSLDGFAIFAAGGGGPMAIAYAHRHPQRVTRLALYGTFSGIGYVWTREMGRSFSDLARADWPMAVRAFGDISLRDVDPEMATQQGQMMLQSVSGERFADSTMLAFGADVTPLLSELAVPTLIVHRVEDAGVPFRLAQEMATMIPAARLVPVPGKANQPAGGDTHPIVDAIRAFLGDDPEPRAHAQKVAGREEHGAFRTVLFTDIVGHTEMMQRLGDAKGRDVLREHERITRETLKAHSGAEVKTMGDGFMASFGSVTSAMECAIALQRAFATHTESMPEPLHVRVGLNAGEPIEEDGDLFGATVILASRIAAKAGAGEILVPDTVRGLLSGKGFMFGDRGEFVPKGFDESVRLWDVRWQE